MFKKGIAFITAVALVTSGIVFTPSNADAAVNSNQGFKFMEISVELMNLIRLLVRHRIQVYGIMILDMVAMDGEIMNYSAIRIARITFTLQIYLLIRVRVTEEHLQ